jgi:hypothetical protein
LRFGEARAARCKLSKSKPSKKPPKIGSKRVNDGTTKTCSTPRNTEKILKPYLLGELGALVVKSLNFTL